MLQIAGIIYMHFKTLHIKTLARAYFASIAPNLIKGYKVHAS